MFTVLTVCASLVILVALLVVGSKQSLRWWPKPKIEPELIDNLIERYRLGECPVGGGGHAIVWSERVSWGTHWVPRHVKDCWLPVRKAREIVRLLRDRGVSSARLHRTGGSDYGPSQHNSWIEATVLADRPSKTLAN
jgi:hypothetical protein